VKKKTPVWSREDAEMQLDSFAAMFSQLCPRQRSAETQKSMITIDSGARRGLRLHEKAGKEHAMPVHNLLERIFNEYIVVAGLQSGQPMFQSVNSAATQVTGVP
jgi:hypothetical protein